MTESINRSTIEIEIARLRQRLASLERLAELVHDLYPPGPELLPAADSRSESTDAMLGAAATETVGTLPLTGIGAQEAVVTILRESQAVWRVPELIDELTRLGWSTASVEPHTVVRTALRRLVARGQAAQVGYGQYSHAPSEPMAALTDQPGLG